MEDGVREATIALVEALARGDAAAAALLYADDGKLLSPAAELISGRLDIESYWRAGIAFGLVGIELDPVELEVVGGVAIEVGRYLLAVEGIGEASVLDRGKYLVLHRRDGDGAWRRVVDVFNPDVPVAARHEAKEER
jgi:ketosteroid isomerase-like protein